MPDGTVSRSGDKGMDDNNRGGVFLGLEISGSEFMCLGLIVRLS